MSNLMFDDFIELDLFDPSEPSNGLFPFYLSSHGLDDPTADLAAAPALATPEDSKPIKQEDHDHSILLAAPLDSHVFADPALALIAPDQLSLAPQVTTLSPTAISLTDSSPLDTAPIAISTAAAVTSAIQSALSQNSSTTLKRSSPEPSSPPRKHAKTESKSKSSSAKRASISATSTAAPLVSSSTSELSSSASSPASSSPEPTTESLTSPVNTTLSPATLQFLLQQQEETPLVPQLFTGKLSREEIEATLARLLESTKHLIAPPEESPKLKDESHASDDDSDEAGDGLDGPSMQTHGLKTQPGIKTDDIPSSTDLKKMTSKERRQLRNKISARNFRVRRKEYIFTLEGQVQQHKTEARHLREAVTLVQEENQRLKDELEMVRRQLAESSVSQSAAADQAQPTTPNTLSKENQSLLTSLLSRNVTSTNKATSVTRPQSPILTPNLKKDVPNSSTANTTQASWKDKSPIMVHTTLIPEICLGDEFQFGTKSIKSKEDDMLDRPWMKLTDAPLDTTTNSFWVSGLVFELMKTFTMSMSIITQDQPTVEAEEPVSSEVDSEADLDWELQQNIWALTQVEEEDEMTEDQVQLLYDLSQLQLSSTRSESPASTQEDPNMLEWLYESMMARLVDLDLQSSQDQSSFGSLTESNIA
ncbi:hypothetical protein B0O80DRAFT_421628 [Mortierella sp. GBAus27b]|nr:hypothetical protein BGX31_011662 [Mortierella sp. GBA43]KAI8362039.1 hypothetical protein B0O80DRAFT_421628 [Mortierella sp. GBAus27b]